eukprot:UN01311
MSPFNNQSFSPIGMRSLLTTYNNVLSIKSKLLLSIQPVHG